MSLRVLLIIGVLLASCTHNPNRPDFKETKIIERMDSVDKTPDYATGQKAMWKEENQVAFAHFIQMSGNTRADACLAAAELSAKTAMLKYIKENITTSGQLDNSSLEADPAYESLTAFLSQGKIHGAQVTDRYYDRREISLDDGVRALKMHCATKITVEKSLLEKQLRQASSPERQGNPEIRQKLLDAQKKFIEEI